MAFYQNNTYLFEVLSIIAVLILSMNGAAGMVQWVELLFLRTTRNQDVSTAGPLLLQ